MGYKEDLHKIFPTVFLEDLDPKEPFAQQAKRIETNFTQLVNAFRGHLNPRLATFGRMLWDLVHHRHVHVSMTEVPSMSFIAATRKGTGNQQGMFMVPPSWLNLLTKEPAMAVGALVFNGSQAIDYYNGRIGKDRDPMTLIAKRSFNYEAEFLRTVPAAMLNQYQREVLGMFPVFDEQFVYDYRPVAPQVS